MEDTLVDEYTYVPLNQRISEFEIKVSKENQILNKPNKNDVNYGRPIEGSKTQLRGFKAHSQISNEVKVLCNVIKEYGVEDGEGNIAIEFGELFQLYTHISNKLVGILLRARKYGLVKFDGEILYQGRDDRVIITLLKLPSEEFSLSY